MLLTACGPKPIEVRTERVEVPVLQPLDPQLTRIPPEPPPPPRSCVDHDGRATVCERDLVDAFEAVRAWGRGLAGQLREIAELQPEPAGR